MRPTLRELRAQTRGERRDMFIPCSDIEVELRTIPSKSEGDSPVLRFKGMAAVFDQSADIGGFFTETVKRGAARKALSEKQDTVFNWDHESRWPLGSISAGNLELREIPTGLEVLADIPLELSYAKDLQVLLEHRIIKGMSVGFTVLTDEWTESRVGGKATYHRDIIEMDRILDVCVTVIPAYTGTSADERKDFRSLELDRDAVSALAKICADGLAAVERTTVPETGVAPDGVPVVEGAVDDAGSLGEAECRAAMERARKCVQDSRGLSLVILAAH